MGPLQSEAEEVTLNKQMTVNLSKYVVPIFKGDEENLYEIKGDCRSGVSEESIQINVGEKIRWRNQWD